MLDRFFVILERWRRERRVLDRFSGRNRLIHLAIVATDISHAARIAEAIRLQLEAEQIVHPDSDVGPHVTISLGVSAMVPNDRNVGDTLLNVADRALYRAKTAGRNQTHKIH